MGPPVKRLNLKRPPKLLRKQAADRFALHILNQANPCITVGLDSLMEKQDYEFKRQSLNKLRQMKDWYWLECHPLGHIASNNRISISNSIMDVLDWKNCFRKFNFIHRYVIQFLFCYEVGQIEKWPEMVIPQRKCQSIYKILRAMGTLYTTKFNDNSVKLMDSQLLILFFEIAQELSFVHLQCNINAPILESLGSRRDTLEVLIIDMEGMYISRFMSLENPLYRLFFNGQSKDVVTECMNNGEDIPVTFTKIREIVFRFDLCPPRVVQLTICLQHFYRKVKVTLTSLVSLPYDSMHRKVPFISPSFLVEKNNENKKVYVYCSEECCADFFAVYNQSFGCSSDVYRSSLAFTSALTEIRRNMMSPPLITSIRFMYHENLVMFLTPTLRDSAQRLTELNIYGLIETVQDRQTFSLALASCKSLRKLTLMMKVTTSPEIILAKIPTLKSLSISFAKFSPLSVFGVEQEIWTPIELFIERFIFLMVQASNKLDFLHIPGNDTLPILAESECFQQLNTLSIGKIEIENLVCCLKKMPKLSAVEVSSDFGYDTYLDLKKRYKCTDLKIIFTKERLVTPYTLV